MSYYVTRCIMPKDRFMSVIDKSLTVVDDEPDHNLSHIIEYHDITGCISHISCYDLGEKLDFEYTQRLVFLHESDLRQSIFQCIEISVDKGWWTEKKKQLLQNTSNPDIYLKYIGFLDGFDVGHGVFTKIDMPKGTYIGEYVGLVSTVSETIVQENHYNFQYPTCDGGVEINGREYGNIMRFVNHSTRPNSEFRAINVDDMMHVICVSASLLKCTSVNIFKR